MTTAIHTNGRVSVKRDGAQKPPPMVVIADNIPQLLKMKPRWVGWRWDWKDRTKKWDKPPIDIKSDRPGSSTDKKTWCDFSTAIKAAESGFVDGIGFALGDGWCGVDIDACRDRITGELSTVARAVIDRLKTYGEVSPSGEGVKLITQGKLPRGRRVSGALEFYDSGRYFTITGHRIDGCQREPMRCEKVLAALHAELIEAPQQVAVVQREAGIDERELALSALAGLSTSRADTYHDWIMVGMALHAVASDLLSAWDSWSQSSAKYVAGECAKKWASFGSGSGIVGIGTLIYWAKQDGWKPPKKTRPKKKQNWKRDAARAAGDDEKSQSFFPRPTTDLGNAERFVSQHGERVRFVVPWKQWLIWTGTHWKADNTAEAERLAKKTVRSIYHEAAKLAEQSDCDAEELAEVVAWAKYSEKRERLSAVVALAGSEEKIAIDHASLDSDPWLLNCSNGTVDLRTGELRPHNPADLITKTTGIEYPIDAGDDSPTWDAFLDSTFREWELIEFLGRLIGYAAVGIVREHVLPILWGSGSNGKSTFLNAILDVLGDYAFQAPQGFLMFKRGETHPTELTDLFGRRFVSIAETQDGQRLDEGLVKMLTGGERIRARRMRENFWEFTPTHTPFLATNYKPVVRGTDYAIWRRLLLVPFTNTFIDPSESAEHPNSPLKDRELPEKLKAESYGILKWIVQGCLRWQREGLSPPGNVRVATSDYREESDSFKRWFSDCCEVDPLAEWKASFAYVKYKTWAETEGERPVSQVRFSRRVEEAGFAKERTSAGVYYYGFRPIAGS